MEITGCICGVGLNLTPEGHESACPMSQPRLSRADNRFYRLPQDRDIVDMMGRDNARMRAAGTRLAEAALHVIREYDGIHRLSLAVSEWAQAIANEGDRPHD